MSLDSKPQAESPLLNLRAVSKTYRGAVPVTALHETDLSICRGDYVGIVGPSGSGKSTLLNVLGLLDKATGGHYEVDGVDVAKASDRTILGLRGHRFGFVFQAFHLLSGRSALDNVEMGMLYTGVTRRARRRLAVESLDRFGLAHRMHADPRHLSGGERQRVAIARALAGSPDVIFCDEPTGNLDSKNTEMVTQLLQDLNQEGLTIVVVTHDDELAERCGRKITVRDGVVSEVAK